MIVKEELDGIDIETLIRKDLIRKLFIHGECGNLKGFVNGGELTRNINENKKPGV